MLYMLRRNRRQPIAFERLVSLENDMGVPMSLVDLYRGGAVFTKPFMVDRLVGRSYLQ